MNPLLPSGDDKGAYVFTEEMLELAPFAKVFPTGPEDPLENKYCFYCMLCRRNISMRMWGLYELKRHFQWNCHFRADQRFREKHCPGKVRGRDGKVLYGSRSEAERGVYMELDVPDLDFKRPFYYDVLEGKLFTFNGRVSSSNPDQFADDVFEKWRTALGLGVLLEPSWYCNWTFGSDC